MALRGGLNGGSTGGRVGGLGSVGTPVGGGNNAGGMPFRGLGTQGMPIGREVFNKLLMTASLIIGVFGAVMARMVYGLLVDSLYRPLVIMITIGIFFVIVGIANIMFNTVRGIYGPTFSTGKALKFFAIALVILLVLSFLFEFIYELGGGLTTSEVGSYAIIIDDSGSMDSSDPTNQRYDAIDIILKDKADDFPYAVYRFSDFTECIRELRPKSDGNQISVNYNGGGTAIKDALKTVLYDYKNGGLKNAENLKVLLLSDGGATDIGFFSRIDGVLGDYAKEGVSVSTVGLGGSVDEGLMMQIANATGGVYLNVSDVADLADTMTVAIESYYKRDLLTYRIVRGNNILYFIERILFMGIIGDIIGFMLVLFADGKKQDISFVIAIGKGLFAAIVLEVFINSIGMNEKLVNYIYFVIVALVISWMFKSEGYGYQSFGGGSMQDGKMTGEPEKVIGQNVKVNTPSGPKTLGR